MIPRCAWHRGNLLVRLESYTLPEGTKRVWIGEAMTRPAFARFRRGAGLLSALLLGFSLGSFAAAPSQAKPSSAEFYEQAVVARQAGDFELAANLFNEVVQRDPGNADAQVLLGYSLLALGDTEAAAIAFEAALGLAPDYQDARLGLAQIAFP